MFRTALAIAACVVFVSPLHAADPVPVTLEAIEFNDATLIVTAISGEQTIFDPAALEALGTYRLETTTPWRPDPAVFEGILLADLLTVSGLAEVARIRVVAENDFSTVIPAEVWRTIPVMIATRVDGKAHTLRARGPLQIVVPDDDYATNPAIEESHLVWMAARIEPG